MLPTSPYKWSDRHGVLAGAMLFGATATATADPPPPVPPPCTAAELARVMSGVTFDTSNYLTEHPDVNDFFTSLKGQPKDQIHEGTDLSGRQPQFRTELQAIRQPSVAFRDRCGVPQPLTRFVAIRSRRGRDRPS